MSHPELHRATRELMEKYQVPGLVVAVARGTGPVDLLSLGFDAAGRPIEPASLFPVASITKLATALAVLRLVDARALSLDDPLTKFLPAAQAARAGITIRDLLSHISGLPDDLAPSAAPYNEHLTWPLLAQACLDTPLEREPRTRVTYSNVGYGLLALVVEQLTRKSFPAALNDLVLVPLGAEAYLGIEPGRAPAQLADIRGHHAGTPLEPFNSRFWRAFAFPWGGLVTNAEGAVKLVRAFAGLPEDFLQDLTRREAVRNQNGDLGGGYGPPFVYPKCPWGLGPDLRGEKTPHWTPANATADCFGHAGASGSVVWYEPSLQVAWAVLGARTADNGWLLRGTPRLGALILEAGAS